MSHIKLTTYPTEHARNSYNAGFYVEAIQVLHGFLEVKLGELLMLSRHGNLEAGLSEVWDLADELSLYIVCKTLYILGKLTKEEQEAINQFNSVRNKIIHKLFLEPYDKIYEGVPKAEYDQAFNEGMRLIEKIERKIEQRVK